MSLTSEAHKIAVLSSPQNVAEKEYRPLFVRQQS